MPEPDRDKRMVDAATRMRAAHGPGHERHAMWAAMAALLERLADLAPYWHEPYAAPFVPIIEAGVRVATAYQDAVAGTTARPQIGSGRRHAEVPKGGPERELYDATHGETAWDEIAALPVARLIRWYRTLPGCSTGGSLHIVLDDLNADDEYVRWCDGYAAGQGDTCGAELASLLLRMDVYTRVCAIMLANGEPVSGVRLFDE